MAKTVFTAEQAKKLGSQVGINLDTSLFDVAQFRRGLDVELEHGCDDPETNVTNGDPVMTAKIAWAHLKELSDYYTRLAIMEGEEDQFSG